MNSFLIQLPAEVLQRRHADRSHSPSGERAERGVAVILAIVAVLSAALVAAF